MTTRYVYNKQKYNSLHTLRQAIWKNEYKCYGEPKTQEDFDSLDLKVTLEEYDPIDEMSNEQIAQRVRNRRNFLIAESDFYVQPDYPSTAEGLEAVKAYRQALRDVPSQTGFPRNVQWPEVPPVLMTGKDKALGLAKTSGLAKVGI